MSDATETLLTTVADGADILAPGERVGRFVVLHRVGRGGLGEIYAAFDPQLSRNVALKVLRTRPGSKSQSRLLTEARSAARVNHPNVVSIFDVGLDEDRVFLAMELVEGVDLSEWIRGSDPRPPLREIIARFGAAAAGLDAAHQAGIVHCDFKPANVLVAKDGRTMLTDFGVARAAVAAYATGTDTGDGAPETERGPADEASAATGSVTVTEHLEGTPAYMSPEQMRGTKPDLRSDVYAFCIALYEGLYGTRPFRGDTRGELLAAKEQGVRFPDRPRVPRRLREILRAGLSPDLDARPRDMQAVAAALRGRQARPRLWMMTGAAATVTATVVTLAMRPSVDCSAPDPAMAATWNAQVRDTVSARLTDNAPAIAQRVLDQLGDWSLGWSNGLRRACEDTHVRGIQSQARLDERVNCYARLRSGLATTLELMRTEAGISRAPILASSLPSVEQCDRADSSEVAFVPADADADTRRAVLRVRTLLEEARVHRIAGQYVDAVARAERAFDMARALNLENKALVAETQSMLGAVLVTTGRINDALEHLDAAYRGALSSGADRTAARAALRRVIATNNRARNPELSRELLALAAALVERAGNLPVDQAELHDIWAGVEQHAGNFQSALEHRTRALELWEAVLGPDHPNVATTLDGLGQHQVMLGDSQGALASFRRSVEIRRNAFGEAHPAVAGTFSFIGNVLANLGRNDEALEHYNRALSLVADHLQHHPLRADIEHNMGSLLWTMGREAEAEAAYERAVSARPGESGDLGMTLTALAMVRHAQGRFTDALTTAEQAYDRVAEMYGPDDAHLVHPLRARAFALLFLGRWREAEPLLDRALELYEARPFAPLALHDIQRSLAHIRWRQGRPEEARKLLRSAREGIEKLGQEHDMRDETWLIDGIPNPEDPRFVGP